MHVVAAMVEALQSNGWETHMELYDITCYKDIDMEDAVAELHELGIDPEDVDLKDDSYDDEESGDEEEYDGPLHVDVFDPYTRDVDMGIDP